MLLKGFCFVLGYSSNGPLLVSGNDPRIFVIFHVISFIRFRSVFCTFVFFQGHGGSYQFEAPKREAFAPVLPYYKTATHRPMYSWAESAKTSRKQARRWHLWKTVVRPIRCVNLALWRAGLGQRLFKRDTCSGDANVFLLFSLIFFQSRSAAVVVLSTASVLTPPREQSAIATYRRFYSNSAS